MSQEEIIKLCEDLRKKNSNQITTVKIRFDDFINNKEIILNEFENKGLLMILEKTAVLTFLKYKQIRFIIISEKNLIQDDFKFKLDCIKIIGSREKYSLKKAFKEDIKNNIKVMLIILLIYFILFNSFDLHSESLTKLNDSLINVTNIFIAAFFVFIAFFNSDMEKIIYLYRNGNGEKFNFNDKYIFKLSISSLVLVIISNGILAFHVGIDKMNYYIAQIKLITNIDIYNIELLRILKYNSAFISTGISIIFLIICFDSILNYYLNKIRNNYFIDAFEEEMKLMK